MHYALNVPLAIGFSDELSPFHEFFQICRKFLGHFLVLPHGWMPICTIAETSVMWREVEAIDFCIALLVGVVDCCVHGLLGREELLPIHHAPAEQNYFRLRVVVAHLAVELLESIEEQG